MSPSHSRRRIIDLKGWLLEDYLQLSGSFDSSSSWLYVEKIGYTKFDCERLCGTGNRAALSYLMYGEG